MSNKSNKKRFPLNLFGSLSDIADTRKLVGFHMSTSGNLMTNFVVAKRLTDVVQVFLTSPKAMSFPKKGKVKELLDISNNLNMRLIFHGPFTSNMVRTRDDTFNYTQKYIEKTFDAILSYNGCVPHTPILVMHTSKIQKESGATYARNRMSNFIFRYSQWAKGLPTNFKLAIETDANSTVLPTVDSATTLDGLVYLFNYYKPLNASICFDTEHSFASGVDVINSAYGNSFPWEFISVVHLNAIPEQVSWKSGKDMHGKCRLTKSKGGTKWIRSIVKACKARNIPMILERSLWEVTIDDLKVIGNTWLNL